MDEFAQGQEPPQMEVEYEDTQNGVQQPRSADPTMQQEEIDITEKQSEKLLDTLNRGFTQYSNARSEWETHWRDSMAVYEGRDGEDAQWPYSARYEIPEAFRQTEGMKALIVNAFFGSRNWFEFAARHNGAEEDANVAAHICRWQIKHFQMEDDIMAWPAEVCHYGVSYITYGWSQFKRLKFKFSGTENEKHDGKWQRETIEELHGAPFVEYLSPWRVYMHPYVDRADQSPIVYIVEPVSGDYLLTQARQGFFDKKRVLKALEEQNAMPTDLPPEITSTMDFDLMGDPEYELMTAYTNGGRVYSIINRKFVVQSQYNKYGPIPVLNLRNYQAPGNAYGTSEPKQLQVEQALIRDLCSMGVDSIFYKLQPMWLYKPELQRFFGDEDFSFRPGMALPAEDTQGALMPVPTTAESGKIFEQAERVRGYAQLKTSYTDIVSGGGAQGVDTAYQHGKLQDAATARLQARIILWEPRIRKLYESMHSLNAQFLDEKLAIKVEGLNGGAAYGRYNSGQLAYEGEQQLGDQEITPGFGPESFEPEIDVEVQLPRTMGSPQERQRSLLTFWNAIGQDPRWAHEPVQEELARAFEFPSPKRLIAQPQRAQRDAAKENADFFAYGVIPDPMASEDHMVHHELHAYALRMPEFKALPKTTQAAFLMHDQTHTKYIQQMQAMPGQQSMPSDTQDMTSPEVRAASSDMAEATSMPGMQGAMEQGEIAQ